MMMVMVMRMTVLIALTNIAIGVSALRSFVFLYIRQ